MFAPLGLPKRDGKSSGEMIVFEIASNAKTQVAALFHSAHHFSGALDSQLLPVPGRRINQKQNLDVGPHRRTLAAVDEHSVERNVGCKAARSVFAVVIPAKDHGELEFVSRGRPPVAIKLNDVCGRG